MRPSRPRKASLDQVRISRDGEYGFVDYADERMSGMRIQIGPEITKMSDAQILKIANEIIDSREKLISETDFTAIEIPRGKPQIRYFERGGQWVPRGDVLRCFLSDDEDGKLVVYVDDEELTEVEFCRMLSTYAGWGLRISFVPEDDVYEEPKISIEEPKNESSE